MGGKQKGRKTGRFFGRKILQIINPETGIKWGAL
jgi:hypothetical protein